MLLVNIVASWNVQKCHVVHSQPSLQVKEEDLKCLLYDFVWELTLVDHYLNTYIKILFIIALNIRAFPTYKE